jgi:hypothetical protein
VLVFRSIPEEQERPRSFESEAAFPLYGEDRDLQSDDEIGYQISAFIKEHQVISLRRSEMFIEARPTNPWALL